MSLQESIQGLRSWIGRMQVTEEFRTVAMQHVEDVSMLVDSRPNAERENVVELSRTRLLLLVAARPEPLAKDDVARMLAEHVSQCPGNLMLDKKGLAVAVTKVTTWPAAALAALVLYREPISAWLMHLVKG